jgi:hypothetical protein
MSAGIDLTLNHEVTKATKIDEDPAWSFVFFVPSWFRSPPAAAA